MGASGSKAARQASRAATAAAPPAGESLAGGGRAAAVPSSIAAAERERLTALLERQRDPAAVPAEHAADNQNLAQSMNTLMAGMRQYQFEVYRNPEVDKRYALKKQTKEEKEAQLVGRLAAPAFKSLLEEHARAVQAGRAVAVEELARRYGADPEVLRLVLQYNSGPVVFAEPDGRLVGTWPKK